MDGSTSPKADMDGLKILPAVDVLRGFPIAKMPPESLSEGIRSTLLACSLFHGARRQLPGSSQ